MRTHSRSDWSRWEDPYFENVRAAAYDVEHRIVAVDGDSYEYDSHGRRIKKTEAGKTTRYVSSSYEITDGVVTKYIKLGGRTIAKWVGNGASKEKYWLHTNHLGSVQARRGLGRSYRSTPEPIPPACGDNSRPARTRRGP